MEVDNLVKNNYDMGTYTIKTFDQNRLQFSGPLHMPWKFIAIKT